MAGFSMAVYTARRGLLNGIKKMPFAGIFFCGEGEEAVSRDLTRPPPLVYNMSVLPRGNAESVSIRNPGENPERARRREQGTRKTAVLLRREGDKPLRLPVLRQA